MIDTGVEGSELAYDDRSNSRCKRQVQAVEPGDAPRAFSAFGPARRGAHAILLWVWVIPLLVGQLILRPYLYAEHTGCERMRSAFDNTRTTYTGNVMKWFAWNMPYHVEHHAYPSIPFHALPQLNQIVADRIAFQGRGYRAVTRETWAWFRGRYS